jgi:Fe-S cluster assembly scaffold protein SufB
MKTKIINLKKHTKIMVSRNTQYILTNPIPLTDGPYIVSMDFSTKNVSSEMIGLFVLTYKEALTLRFVSNHTVSHTKCLVRIKTVLMNHSYFGFCGKIIIQSKAYQTVASLREAVLIRGKTAQTLSAPALQIDTNAVTASHAATIHTIDGAELYYLKSRGLSDRQSKKVITEGFLEDELNHITDLHTQDLLRKALYRKI